ncbi:MAG: hypothetical protein KAZ18_02960 [Acinetobacter sp.]|nr:hypothetical protein [Acinetobacter sp.]
MVEDSQDYALGGYVVYKQTESVYIDLANALYEILEVHNDYFVVTGANYDSLVMFESEIRHATTAELKAKCRLPAPVALFISPQVESVQPHSPEKLTILDLGYVSDIGNHISPLCKVLDKSYMTDVINHLVRAHKAQQEVS